MTPVLTIISGGADTGKSLIAEALVAFRGQPMVARDAIRAALSHPIDEWLVTRATFGIARELLAAGQSVVCVGWNLEPSDREGWMAVARETGAAWRWVTVEAGSAGQDISQESIKRDH